MARKSRLTATTEPARSTEKSWKAGIYRRLSVEDGDDPESNSLGNQEKICRSFAAAKGAISIVGCYTDHGYSGMNYSRPGFREMMDDLDTGKINCILVKDVSRFGRQYLTTSEYLQRVFPDRGVRFVAVNDDYDSLDPASDADGLLLPFKMILNDSYAKDISKKIRSSISAKMNAGAYLPASTSIPYGYLRDPERHTYDIDEEAAAVVRRVFHMRAEGMPFNTIAVTLNREGVPSPGRLRFLRGVSKDKRFQEAAWVRGTIRKMLSDPVYLGKRIHGRTQRERLGAEKQRQTADRWQVVEDAHPPIVSQALFDAAQRANEAAEKRRAHYVTHEKCAEDLRELFHNKLFCGDCGARMLALKHDQRIASSRPPMIVYQCNAYQYSNRTKCCNHYTRQDTILAAVRNVLDSQLGIADNPEDTIKEYRRRELSDAENKRGALQSARVKRGNIESKLERLLLDVTDGILDRGEYLALKSKYERELARLTREETEAAERLAQMRSMADAARSRLEHLNRYRRLNTLNSEIMDALVKKISIFQGGRIHVELNFTDPYGIYRDMPGSPKEGGRENAASGSAI